VAAAVPGSDASGLDRVAASGAKHSRIVADFFEEAGLMSHTGPFTLAAGAAIVAALAAGGAAQSTMSPVNDLPNPYRTVENHFKMPEGRTWGSTSAVGIDKDGKSIWIAERCGANSCLDSPTVNPIMKFDADGHMLKSFGAGMLIFPHGMFVDRDGNIWITDGQDNAPRPARGARGERGMSAPVPTGPIGPPPGATAGHQIYKFSPDGKLLMTLGKKGGAAEPDYFYQPNAVLVAPNGTIFVAEGHGAGDDHLFKFSKDGTLIKTWGKKGTGPNEYDQPHALAMDSRGRLFVGDRNNNRIQILDQDGKYLAEWPQFSRPSGVFIDAHDTIYVGDSESESVSRNHDGWKRGIRIGSAKDGSVKYFIPDPNEKATNTSNAEGVAADAQGNIYGAEVGQKDVKKYVKP
jgi:sugar lactone lactonase YvrE